MKENIGLLVSFFLFKVKQWAIRTLVKLVERQAYQTYEVRIQCNPLLVKKCQKFCNSQIIHVH